jgi:hypothetical protein
VRPVSDAQVRKVMEEMTKHGEIGRSAMKGDMDRKTARKYVRAGKLPSEMKKVHDWPTRKDPFEEDWPELRSQLEESPELEAKTLFEALQGKHPGRYEDSQLRTLQRRVRRWRAQRGPDKDVVFEQRHRPGEAAQSDFTHATELGVTIVGELFVHMLYVFVLPFSNWQWGTVCLSESMASLRHGLQRALFQLGRVPTFHQTDNSTAATHRIPPAKKETLPGRKRPFNEDYLALMRHFGLEPRTTKVGAKEQNGDVEAGNGAIKRKLRQALLLRGSRDFDSVQSWQQFIDDVIRKSNATKGARVRIELDVMREVDVKKLPEYVEERVIVSEHSTIRVKHCAYSVPSRLIHEELRVRVYEDRIEVYYGESLQLACERLHGKAKRIDYRHVIWSLVRKPGAFARYVYREEMFPSLVFRRAYDAIQRELHGIKADVEYLRILHHAASTMESDVEAALALLLEEGRQITADEVKSLVSSNVRDGVPQLTELDVQLCVYDVLLGEVGT